MKPVPQDDCEAISQCLSRRNECRATRNQIANRIDALDRSIVDAKLELARLCNKFCSALKLPSRVASLVFEYSALLSQSDGQPFLMEVVVSHVCQSWRNVAINLPHLWSRYSFKWSGKPEVSTERLHIYLERSRDFTLELFFDFTIRKPSNHGPWDASRSLPDPLMMQDWATPVLKSAISAIHRWRYVTLVSNLPNTTIFKIRDLLRHTYAPNLEYFHLDLLLEGFRESDANNPINVVLKASIFGDGTPKLTSSIIRGTRAALFMLPPLPNLTALHLEFDATFNQVHRSVSLASLCTILNLSNLVNVSIIGVPIGNTMPDEIPSITMNDLVHLRITDCQLNLWRVVSSLTAPKLQSLAFSNRFQPCEFSGQVTYTTFPSLKTLILQNCRIPDTESFVQFCRMTETVKTVYMISNLLSDTITSAIAANLHVLHIWPNLGLLSLDISPEANIGSLLAFSQRRSKTFQLAASVGTFSHWRSRFRRQYDNLARLITLVGLSQSRINGIKDSWPPSLEPFCVEGPSTSPDFSDTLNSALTRLPETDRSQATFLLRRLRELEIEPRSLTVQLEELDKTLCDVNAQFGTVANKSCSILSIPAEVAGIIFEYVYRHGLDSRMAIWRESGPGISPTAPDIPVQPGGEESVPHPGFSENMVAQIQTSHIPTEVVLSHVCHSWRSLALLCPSLWSTFILVSSKNTDLPTDAFKAYMDRSQNQTLDLFFDFTRTGNHQAHITLLPHAISHVHRWRRITLLSDVDTHIGRVVPMLSKVHAPNLEYFVFQIGQTEPSMMLQPSSQVLAQPFGLGAPKLTFLSIDDSIVSPIFPVTTNITTLLLHYSNAMCRIRPTEFYELLKIPMLRNLSLHNFLLWHRNAVRLPPTPIQMDELVHLRIGGSVQLLSLLGCVSFPKLRSLLLQDMNISAFVIVPARETLFPSLESLTVKRCTISNPILNDLFELAPSITALTLVENKPAASIISPGHGDQLGSWPALSTLNIGLNVDSEPLLSNFMPFIQSRLDQPLILTAHHHGLGHTFEFSNFYDVEMEGATQLPQHVQVKSVSHPFVAEAWPPGDAMTSYYSTYARDPFIITNVHARFNMFVHI